MVTEEQIQYKNIAAIIAAIMLLLAIPDIWPYGYYQILRWVVTVTAAFTGYLAYGVQKKSWVGFMTVTAILFNPIAPIHLEKEVWVVIDLGAAIMFFAAIRLRK